MLHDERYLKMSVRPPITNIFQLFCADGSLVFVIGIGEGAHDFDCLFMCRFSDFAVSFESKVRITGTSSLVCLEPCIVNFVTVPIHSILKTV